MLSLAACSDSSVDANEEVTGYSFTIDGTSYSGNSFFFSGTDPEEQESACVIYFTDAADVENISDATQFGFMLQFRTCETATSSVTAFDFEEGTDEDELQDHFAFFFQDTSNSGMPLIYFSQSGNVNLNVSGNRVTGSMNNVNAVRLEFSQGEEPEQVDIDLAGSFEARSTDFTNYDNVFPF